MKAARSSRRDPHAARAAPPAVVVDAVFAGLVRAMLADHDLSARHIQALLAIAADPTLTLAGLSEKIGVNHSNASKILATLVDYRLVKRADNPESRRVVLMTPTKTGIEMVERLCRGKAAFDGG